MNETHVKHTVGLIEHEVGDVVQMNDVLSDKVEQTAWSGDKYIDALFEGTHLRVLVHSAINDGVAQRGVFGIIGERVVDLYGELACGSENEGLDVAAVALSAMPFTSCSMMGMAKAAVLPVPVCAKPMMSFPISPTGMACC